MSRKSKRPNIPTIPSEVGDAESQPFVSAEVAVSETIKDWDHEPLVFQFREYKQGQCEIRNFEKSDADSLTRKLSTTSKVTLADFKKSYIKCYVENSGDYQGLFDRLPPMTEIAEVEFTQTGRIFGFVEQNRFQVVAFCKKHRGKRSKA